LQASSSWWRFTCSSAVFWAEGRLRHARTIARRCHAVRASAVTNHRIISHCRVSCLHIHRRARPRPVESARRKHLMSKGATVGRGRTGRRWRAAVLPFNPNCQLYNSVAARAGPGAPFLSRRSEKCHSGPTALGSVHICSSAFSAAVPRSIFAARHSTRAEDGAPRARTHGLGYVSTIAALTPSLAAINRAPLRHPPAPQLDQSDQRRVSTALARTCNAEEAQARMR